MYFFPFCRWSFLWVLSCKDIYSESCHFFLKWCFHRWERGIFCLVHFSWTQKRLWELWGHNFGTCYPMLWEKLPANLIRCHGLQSCTGYCLLTFFLLVRSLTPFFHWFSFPVLFFASSAPHSLESCSFLMKAEITGIEKRRARKRNGNQLLWDVRKARAVRGQVIIHKGSWQVK